MNRKSKSTISWQFVGANSLRAGVLAAERLSHSPPRYSKRIHLRGSLRTGVLSTAERRRNFLSDHRVDMFTQWRQPPSWELRVGLLKSRLPRCPRNTTPEAVKPLQRRTRAGVPRENVNCKASEAAARVLRTLLHCGTVVWRGGHFPAGRPLLPIVDTKKKIETSENISRDLNSLCPEVSPSPRATRRPN